MQDSGLETNTSASLPHSKVGIAALVTSLLGVLIFCIGFGIAFSIGFTGRGVVNQSSTTFRLATFILCGSLIFSVISTGLGIGSLFQAQQNKTFGIIGLVLSVIILCVYGILAVIGMTMS